VVPLLSKQNYRLLLFLLIGKIGRTAEEQNKQILVRKSMSQRFFVENSIDGDLTQLEGAEALHFLHVMRGKVGSVIVLFDGSNQEFTARVTETHRKSVDLDVLEARTVDRESTREVSLGVALPKGDHARWLVEKLTDLGVRRLLPLRTERGFVPPVDAALTKLRRAIIEASKQCGRNKLMEIAQPVDWQDFVSESGDSNGLARFVAHPDFSDSGSKAANAAPFAGEERLLFAVGPEGGLTEEEIALAESHGWKTIHLGSRILRIETAAITLAAWAALE